jgi:hypothetical protein
MLCFSSVQNLVVPDVVCTISALWGDGKGYGINASGEVVGNSTTDGFAGQWHRGTTYDRYTLLAPTDPLYGVVTFTDAGGINDVGQIVGNDAYGHAYLRTLVADPVPAPTSLALLGAGVFSALFARRH